MENDVKAARTSSGYIQLTNIPEEGNLSFGQAVRLLSELGQALADPNPDDVEANRKGL